MSEDRPETSTDSSKLVETGGQIQQKTDHPRRYQKLKDLKNKMQEKLRGYKKTEPDTDVIAQPRKYKRFDSMDEYKEEKQSNGNLDIMSVTNEPDSKPVDNNQGQLQEDHVDENKKIYNESNSDPLIQDIEQRIITNTNLDPRVKDALNNTSGKYTDMWQSSFAYNNITQWGHFVRDYPEKARAYANKNPNIRAALEEFDKANAKADNSDRNTMEESSLGYAPAKADGPIIDESVQKAPESMSSAWLINENTTTGDSSLFINEDPPKENIDNVIPETEDKDPNVEEKENVGLPRPEAIKRENQYMQEDTDKWDNNGNFTIEDDLLLYMPNVEDRELKKDEDRYEYRRKRSRRGFEITMETDATGGNKVLSPMAWKILETDPTLLEKYKFTLPEDNIVFSPDLFYKFMAGKAMYVWEKLNVDKNTLMKMQHQIVEYLKTEVEAGKLDEGILKTARGILKVNEKILAEKIKTVDKKPSIGPVKIERPFGLLKPDKWTKDGKIERKGDELIFEDQKLKDESQERRLTIGKADPGDSSGEKKTLTEAAWAIIRKVPRLPKNESSIAFHNDIEKTTDAPLIETYSRPYLTKPWQESVKAKYLTADLDTIIFLQAKIARYVEEQVANGIMDEEILDAVSGLLRYKYGNLVPDGYTSFLQTEMKYKIKGNKIYKPSGDFKVNN